MDVSQVYSPTDFGFVRLVLSRCTVMSYASSTMCWWQQVILFYFFHEKQ